MSDSNQREEAVFEAALRLQSAARATYLDEACAGDSALRERIEGLLGALDRAGGLLSEPALNRAEIALAVGATPTAQPGEHIGHYKLLQQIGEGGCGVVYMAEQEEPVRRRVALKILKLGMDTKQVIARFEAERQALALMDHPNIAKVFDAGATDTGRPYFVMELVRGVRITEFCDENQLPMKQRLELFIQVCQAIQHAHQKGVIHRDIKPSNILVTVNDGVSLPKVIDFGIAKATTGQPLTDKTLFTAFEQFIGTPAYMSPEQAMMTSVDIDTRSDIYSLGVLLYELLTSKTPFDTKELLQAGLDEMRRTIREKEPARPSTRLSTMVEGELTTTAKRRHVEPPKLVNLVRGDLDWIVMKCLEKDRARRYETASSLATDILHHLAAEPVTAAAPSRLYRLRKFVRRNKGPVLAATAVLTVLVAGSFGTTIGWLGQTRERAEAQRQAQVAKRQTAIADAVGKFQSDMLASADPAKLLGDKVTVLQAVSAAVKELDAGKLKDQPLVEASVRKTIGNTLRGLGRHAAAEPNLRKALDLVRKASPAGHEDIAASLNNLSVLLWELQKLAEAEALAREALAACRSSLPKAHLTTAQSLETLAEILRSQRKFAEAAPLYREALEIGRKARPPDHPDIAVMLNNYAWMLKEQGRLREAEPLFRQALVIQRKALPAGHPVIATTLNNLALLQLEERRFSEAEPLFQEALAIKRQVLPPGHPDLALSLNNLALVVGQQGKLAEADPLLREALEINRNSLPAGHPQIASGLYNVASLFREQGKFTEADPLYREALEFGRKNLPLGHPLTVQSMIGWASSLCVQGRTTEAEPLLREVLEMCRTNRPPGHLDVALSLNNLASVLGDEEAEPLYREALVSYERAFGKDDWQVALVRMSLGRVLSGLKRYAEAEPALLEAERVIAAAKGVPAGRHDKCAQALVDLYTAWGKSEPGKGWDTKAEQWKLKRATIQPPATR